MTDIPKDVKLPNPQNSIDHGDVAPIVEVDYDDAPEKTRFETDTHRKAKDSQGSVSPSK